MSAINATSSPDRAVVDPSSSPFCPVSMVRRDDPSDVAARPIQAGNESGFDRVGAAIKHDWSGGGRLPASDAAFPPSVAITAT